MAGSLGLSGFTLGTHGGGWRLSRYTGTLSTSAAGHPTPVVLVAVDDHQDNGGHSVMADPQLDAEALRRILRALPGVVIVVGSDRRVLYMSRPDGVHRPEDLEGRDALEALAPDSRSAAQAGLERAFRDGETVKLDPIEVVGPEGDTQWYEATITPIEEEGRTAFVVILSTNVTERVLTEKERAMLEQLVPLCAWCRRIRTDEGDWLSLEAYLTRSRKRAVTHGICSDCERDMSQETANSA